MIQVMILTLRGLDFPRRVFGFKSFDGINTSLWVEANHGVVARGLGLYRAVKDYMGRCSATTSPFCKPQRTDSAVKLLTPRAAFFLRQPSCTWTKANQPSFSQYTAPRRGTPS